jgi:hypothetical protein
MHIFISSLDDDQEIETCLSERNNEVNVVLLFLSTLFPITDCICRFPCPTVHANITEGRRVGEI